MSQTSFLKVEGARRVRTPDEHRVRSSSNGTIIVNGWRIDFEKVKATKLLHGSCGYSLKDAKQLVDRILDDEVVRVVLPDHVKVRPIAERLRRIGAKARIPRSRMTYHVIPAANGWSVKAEGARKASRTFQKKSDALTYARQVARARNSAQLRVHKRNGQLQAEYTYGRDRRRDTG